MTAQTAHTSFSGIFVSTEYVIIPDSSLTFGFPTVFTCEKLFLVIISPSKVKVYLGLSPSKSLALEAGDTRKLIVLVFMPCATSSYLSLFVLFSLYTFSTEDFNK